MKAEFNINCPLSLDEANEIKKCLRNMMRKFKYGKTNKEYKLTVEFHNGARYCYYGKTKKEALSEFRKSFGSFRGFIKKEWEIIINN